MIKAIGAEQDNLRDKLVTDPELVEGPASDPPTSPVADPEQSRRAAPEAENPQPSGTRQTAECCPQGEGGGPSQSEIQNPQFEVPFLTYEEKRRILARIARVNVTDCFDDTGAFDIAKAKRILPPGAVRHIAVHETTRLNAEGQPVTERRINVRLVDPVSALRLDDQLERRRERAASGSSSDTAADPDAPPPHPASPEYAHMLLRQNTKGLDEALHTLALLKKALAEKKDRQLQLSKELDEKDHQLSKTLSLSNGSETLSKVEGDATQRDTGCQPVQTIQSHDQSREAGFSTPLSEKSPTLSKVEGDATQRDTGCQPVSPKPEFVGQALRLPEFPNTPEPGTASDPKNLRPIRPSTQRDTGCQPVQQKPEPSTSLRTPTKNTPPPIPPKSPTHFPWTNTPPPPAKPPRPPPSPLQPVPRRHVSPSGMLTVTEF